MVVILFLTTQHVAATAQEDRSGPPRATKERVDFIRDIQPILSDRCYSCHGPDKQESELRWDTRASALKGGTSGPAIIPGDSAGSRMIHLVAGLDKDLVMPTKGARLSPDQIQLLRAWIDQGVQWPDEVAVPNPTDKSDWWSFKTATRPAVPKINNANWARNDIDLFILAKLQQEKLKPSPEADRRTLIRRLSFDLTGLPPTPAELESFLRDKSPDAYEQLVDRLLASPRYGERWARHWLDTVHYGDTHGYDKDKPRPTHGRIAITSFARSTTTSPIARFIEEQFAGDVLYPGRAEGDCGAGFHRRRPVGFRRARGVADRKIGRPDRPQPRSRRHGDRPRCPPSRASTAHCARCHNHKFDPISQEDYYSLQAVFAGVDRADREFDLDNAVAAKRRPLKNEKSTLETILAARNAETAKLSSPDLVALDQRLSDAKKERSALEARPTQSNGYHSAIEPMPDVTKWVQVDLGQTQPLDAIHLVPALPVDFPDTPGFGFPTRFKVEISDDADFKTATVLTNSGASDFPNPGDKAVVVQANQTNTKYIRVTATKLWKRTGDYVFALAELQAFSGGTNVALRGEVSSLDSIEAGLWSKKNLTDGFSSRAPLLDRTPTAEETNRLAQLKNEISDVEKQRKEIVQSLIPANLKTEIAQLTNRLAAIGLELGALPPSQKVYAAASDFASTGSFHPAKTPRPVHLLARGEVKQPRERMYPAAIAAVPGPEADFQLGTDGSEGAGRAALAKWITDPKNLLTRRSIVNRVWHYHFGRGIVETPNDFGHMGALPTHPALLDWLAFWFQENGESLKKLHRLIVTSATYRQSSAPNEAYSRIDSDNRYLWRMNRSRLDAESIRDSMLLISGKLDATMGGPAVQQFAFKDDHLPDYDYTKFDVESAASYRRSIYRFIVRSVPDPLMESLDCPDPSILTPKRSTTMTSLQALAILNNPFVLSQCEHLAERVKSAGDLKKQINQSYQLALNRNATETELKKLVPFAQRNGMTNFCRLLFNTSEFMFVD